MYSMHIFGSDDQLRDFIYFMYVCSCADWAGEPAVVTGGVSAAVPQTGCSNPGW